jgi:histidine ammonia-lyase
VSEKIIIGDKNISIEDVIAVAYDNIKVELSEESKTAVIKSRKIIETIVNSNQPVYGVTTGVGKLASVVLNSDEIDMLQRNIVCSHAAGTGPLFDIPIVRAAMFLRACSLSAGYSGIKLETLELLLAFLNNDICPIVPQQGSVGSSGDLAPLSHIALALIGQGECIYNHRRIPVSLALKLTNLEAAKLEAKEGLALINGTQFMAAVLSLSVYAAENLAKTADIAGTLSLEAANGFGNAFHEQLHAIRPHTGQANSAANVRLLTEDSKLLNKEPGRIQDGYSLRCLPVVHGASRDAIEYARQKVEIEINSVTDNPSVFSSDLVISGGNFHGQPMALVADFLGIAVSEIGSISERRTNRLLDGTFDHLPMFLTRKPGLHSGLMIHHYTAASLASENKGLAHPNSVDSIPTSANQEDHNSMGTIAARNAATIIDNVTAILAIEIMTAAQALDFCDPAAAGKGTYEAYKAIREIIPMVDEDRFAHPDIEECKSYIATGDLVTRVEASCGEIK